MSIGAAQQSESIESVSVGSVRPGSREHLWAVYEAAIGDWEQVAAGEREQFAAYLSAVQAYGAEGRAWRAKRDEEEAAWRRCREAFDAWRRAVDNEPAMRSVVQDGWREVS